MKAHIEIEFQNDHDLKAWNDIEPETKRYFYSSSDGRTMRVGTEDIFLAAQVLERLKVAIAEMRTA